MNYKEFLEYVRTDIEDYFGSDAKVTVETILRNNNVRLDGLAIFEKGSDLTPTIYLNEFYEKYLNEVSLSEIIEQIIEAYEERKKKNKMDFSFILDYEKIKDKIVFRLVNKNENEELLKDVPNKEFLDLAMCYGVLIRDPHFNNGIMLIHNSHLAMWNVTKEDIGKEAQVNTPAMLKPWFGPIDRLITDFMREEESDYTDYMQTEEFDRFMYVLTNSAKFHGSACICYDGLLADIAKHLECGFYIIPSSVHEVIIVPKSCGATKWELMDMVKAVNDEEVSREEILSYIVYEYDEINDIIHI